MVLHPAKASAPQTLLPPPQVCVLLAMPVDSTARFRRRGQVFTAVEYSCALYRQLPPAPLWYHFFSSVRAC